MANEKTVSISFAVAPAGLTGKVAQASKSANYSFSGTELVGAVFNATTSYAAISLGALASFERIYLQNLDATNFISIAGSATPAELIIKILPGEANYFTPSSASTLYIKADTAAVKYIIVACEP